ncbi:MAG: PSD1 and planctomycete cytochrome C domain-containing protein [Planctomycetota bacterium]|nr:PSD1 and planctomycete cytochrome C domain-containing protein [Planctomycetota bacterium]
MYVYGLPGNPLRLNPAGLAGRNPFISALVRIVRGLAIYKTLTPAAWSVVLLALGAPADQAAAAGPGEEGVKFFESRIRPVLVSKCLSCHSQDAAKAKKLKGKLLLDSRAGVLAGGESGPAVVPGQPEQSLLLQAMRHQSLEMPPNERLSENVIGNFAKWIEMGAPDPRDGRKVDLRVVDLQAGRQHWAFLPLKAGALPHVHGEEWVRNPVDRFVLARLQLRNMTPAIEADRRTLIRRVYFDLIGLPPSPGDVKRFLADQSATAYQDLIERLLKSEHYGERWARHWLDVARFGESDGSDVRENKLRPDAWKYRDAVITALNEDLPYNEFVTFQLAGRGLAANSSLASDLARFPQLGTTLKDSDNPNDKMFHRLDDMVSTTGSAFLGLTIGCARCHDHKIDPITAEEYYRLTAVFFKQVKVEPRASERKIPLEIREPHLLAGGSWKRPVRKVTPGFVEVLMRGESRSEDWLAGTSDASNLEPRYALALWMTDADRGAGQLLARVIVNRIWQHHFGRGIVDTPNDFGFLGASPTHPQLLDWLAGELLRNGWRLKPLHRLILNSATYRQASSARWVDVDRDNRSIWHYQTRRLEAEIIRDNALCVSGTLKHQMHGPSTRVGSLAGGAPFEENPETWRRSVYMMAPRFDTHPVLRVFDAVDNFQSVGARTVSTTPSGALFMLNASFLWQRAELMAARIEQEAGREPSAQVKHIYEIAFARPPTDEERMLGIQFLERTPDKDGESGKPALVHYCHAIMGLNEFIYIR